jgi:hypothetical protein
MSELISGAFIYVRMKEKTAMITKQICHKLVPLNASAHTQTAVCLSPMVNKQLWYTTEDRYVVNEIAIKYAMDKI